MRATYLIFIILFSNFYFAQTLAENKISTPTSPEVAMFKRFGDIPVSLYTGVAGTTVPLYSLNVNGFSIPISLDYQASGIKLDDQATWVGLGWNLMPEGVIYQNVRGKADQLDVSYVSPNEYAAFYNRLATYPGGTGRFKVVKQRGYADYDWCMPTSGIPLCFPPSPPVNSDADVVVNDLVYRKYGEVDTFRFNFFGHTGSFFINLQTRQVVLIDKSEDIQFDVAEGSIVATDDKGIKYTFGEREIFTSYYGNPLTSDFSSRSYKITQIELPTKQKIFFDYEDANYSFYTFSQSKNVDKYGYNLGYTFCDGKINKLYQNPFAIMNASDVKMLKKIRTDDVIAQFNLEGRDDINILSSNNVKRLQSIDITNARTNKKLKTVDFNYSYFPYIDDFPSVVFPYNLLNPTLKDALGKRLKLDKVSISTYDSSENKINIGENYDFEYNLTNTLPPKVSFAKDFWGFYNGHSSNVLLPDLRFFIQSSTGLPIDYEFNNRYSNKTFVDAYMLKKIKYPTKGYTEFDYEINSFKNQFIPSHDQVIDLTRTNLLNNTGIGGYSSPHKDTLTIKVTAGPKTIRFLNRFSGGFDGGPYGPQSKRYDFYQLVNAGASIQFMKLKTNANGTTNTQVLKQWDLASLTNASTFNQTYSYEWEEIYTIDSVDPDPTTRYMVKLNLNPNMYVPADMYHSAGVFSTVTYIDSPAVGSGFTCFGHGPRIKSIKNYSLQGTLAEWKNYEYDEGILHNKISPLMEKDYYCFDCTSSTYCSGNASYNNFWYISDQVTSNEFDAVGYGKVTEKKFSVDNPLQSQGSTEYYYNNHENATANFFPVIKNQTNGLIREKLTKDSNNNLLQADTYIYRNLIPFNQFYSVRPEKKFLLGGTGRDPVLASSGEYDGISKYHYYITPMMSESHKIDTIIHKQYFNNKVLESVETFTYNSKGSIWLHTNQAPNEKIKTEYEYADVVGNAYLESKKMFGIPLVTRVERTADNITKTLSLSEVKYPESNAEAAQKTSGLPLPYSLLDYNVNDINNNIYPPSYMVNFSYDQYDIKGNLQQYSSKDGVPTAIIWGYNNTQPIAKIVGATYAQVSSFIAAIVSASDTDASASPNNDESAFLTVLDTFRKDINMAGYQITTYTYDPLIGVRSITPPSGVREIYLYDSANRLKEIREGNQSGKLLKEFNYNYKN